MSETLEIQAALVSEYGGPFVMTDLRLERPRGDEVLVRVVASGICHTDLAARNGLIPLPLPIVLGHEGAGVVVETGENVTDLFPGDHVVLTYLTCGDCPQCQAGEASQCRLFVPLCFAGCRPDGTHAVHGPGGNVINDRFFGQSSFATHLIAHRRNAIKVPRDVPLETLAPLGCGIMTGAGTVWNVLKPEPGAGVAVFGAGSVGLSAIMAAKVAKAGTIIAVDIMPSRLATALELGATHVIDARDGDSAEKIRAIMPDGVGSAFDTTGRFGVMRHALQALDQGGKLALVSISEPGDLPVNLQDLISSCKTIHGVLEGGGNAATMIAEMIRLQQDGLFPYDKLITTYPYSQINEACADAISGKAVKAVLRM